MSVAMSQVLATARTLLNDDVGSTFTDPVLIPKIQEAHRELQEELWITGSPIVRALSAPIAYTSPNTNIDAGLPTDMLCPTALFENASGSLIGAAGWQPMTEAFYVPIGMAQSTVLSIWVWQGEKVLLVGASANRAVLIQYRRLIPIPQVATDLIGLLFGESYLAARSAAIAAGTLASAEVYTAMTALAKENLAKVISANRGSQKPLLKP